MTETSLLDQSRLSATGSASTAAQADTSTAPATSENQATLGGKVAFALGLSLLLSSMPDLRIPIGGLQAHAYLLILALAGLALFFQGRRSTDVSLHGWGVLFLVGVICANMFSDRFREALSINVKWLTIAVTFFTVARLLRTHRDLQLATAGLIIGVTMIGIRGLVLHQQDPTEYIEPMRGIGSRNVFSNWTIAPLLLCAWFASMPAASTRLKVLAFLSILAMIVPQALSLSRSGWVLIAATFAFTLLRRRSARTLVGGILAGAVLYFAASHLEFQEKAEMRFEALRAGTEADDLRLSIVRAGFEVFADHPIVGVSQSELPYEIAHLLWVDPVRSHNLYVELFAGTGLVGVVPFFGCAIVLILAWRRALEHRENSPAAELGTSLLVLVALGAIRALTTDEVLYNPSYVMGLAIAFKSCRMIRDNPASRAPAIR